MNEIIFNSREKFNSLRKENEPVAIKKEIPKWYLNGDKYKLKDGEYVFSHGEKQTGWKSCPAILDTLISGYALKTPCDILIRKNGNSFFINAEKGFESFVGTRGEENGFPVPYGYDKNQFYWVTNWVPQVPKGYTCLFVHPLNRFDLPFLTISGYIDCDEFQMPGRLPFFIKNNFEGFISAGTVFAQIIPIRQEDWKLKLNYLSDREIDKLTIEEARNNSVSNTRTNYKERFWIKKKYE
jgi:hypothetical protein